jgi:hypothetical protein
MAVHSDDPLGITGRRTKLFHLPARSIGISSVGCLPFPRQTGLRRRILGRSHGPQPVGGGFWIMGALPRVTELVRERIAREFDDLGPGVCMANIKADFTRGEPL